jgi:TRAP-type C4-dicarboxylate transport system permease small subunit
MLEIVHDEKSPILQVPGSLTYACVMAGLLMLGLLALKSAWNAWAAPPVERDPNEEPAVPEAHW